MKSINKSVAIIMLAFAIGHVPAHAQLGILNGLINKGKELVSKKSSNSRSSTSNSRSSTRRTTSTPVRSIVNDDVVKREVDSKYKNIVRTCNEDGEWTVTITGTLPYTGMENGHPYVDMGFDVKWAAVNVGATEPEGRGDYFAYGEADTKRMYTRQNCSTYEQKIYQSHVIENPKRDAVRKHWGGKWRLPTSQDVYWLKLKAKWETATMNGVHGYLVTSKKNGNAIFLPAWGWAKPGWNKEKVDNEDWGFYYWTATEMSLDDINMALAMAAPGALNGGTETRDTGLQVRGVFGPY